MWKEKFILQTVNTHQWNHSEGFFKKSNLTYLLCCTHWNEYKLSSQFNFVSYTSSIKIHTTETHFKQVDDCKCICYLIIIYSLFTLKDKITFLATYCISYLHGKNILKNCTAFAQFTWRDCPTELLIKSVCS